jgi:HlyD family secretion protein
MKRKLPIAAAVLLIAAGALWLSKRGGGEDGLILLSGNIEVTDVDVSFKTAGRVASRVVDEGHVVSKGQLIAELDTAELEQQVAEAAAAAAVAEARLAELEAGTREQEIDAARAEVSRWESEKRLAEFELERQATLDESYAAVERERRIAQSSHERATALLNAAQAKLALALAGARKEQIDQAKAAFQQARAGHERLGVLLREARLVSPFDGVVLAENVEPGEFVAPGTPVVTIADLKHVWLRAYVDEPDLGRIKLGQRAEVRTDSYPDKVYEGVISFIAGEAEFTPKNVQTAKQRVRLVYRVKIDIGNPNMELKAGMPADALIDLDRATTSQYVGNPH